MAVIVTAIVDSWLQLLIEIVECDWWLRLGDLEDDCDSVTAIDDG
jgi:hypothetical protein